MGEESNPLLHESVVESCGPVGCVHVPCTYWYLTSSLTGDSCNALQVCGPACHRVAPCRRLQLQPSPPHQSRRRGSTVMPVTASCQRHHARLAYFIAPHCTHSLDSQRGAPGILHGWALCEAGAVSWHSICAVHLYRLVRRLGSRWLAW